MIDYGITYRAGASLDPVGYVDSDFAGCKTMRQSTKGNIFLVARGLVSWVSRTCGAGAEQPGVEWNLLWSGRELTTKVEEQPWPQLMRCASICCHICGCIFQEDRIVVRGSGKEWYID